MQSISQMKKQRNNLHMVTYLKNMGSKYHSLQTDIWFYLNIVLATSKFQKAARERCPEFAKQN